MTSDMAAPAVRRPAQQARSRQTRERLLQAGLRLVDGRDFDAVSIAQVSHAAGCSVGAFYHHFQDKEAFYTALIDTTTVRLWAEFEDRFRHAQIEALATPALLRLVTQFIRTVMADNQGLIRAALKRSMQDPAAWAPIRAFARRYEDAVGDLVAERAADFAAPELRPAFRIGMQMAYGTLFSAIINRPEPLKIEDPAIVDALSDMLARYLQLRPDP